MTDLTFFSLTCVQSAEPAPLRRHLIQRAAGYAAALTALTAGAHLSLPLPYIPFTLQLFAVFGVGLTLGASRGLYALMLYLAAGFAGLPVFSAGGGPLYLLQPSCGYLFGFAAAAYLLPLLVYGRTGQPQLRRAGFWRVLFCSMAVLAAVYACGAIYWAALFPVSFSTVLYYGALLPLPGYLVICLAAALLVKLRTLL